MATPLPVSALAIQAAAVCTCRQSQRPEDVHTKYVSYQQAGSSLFRSLSTTIGPGNTRIF